jgi:hypothetical protein
MTSLVDMSTTIMGVIMRMVSMITLISSRLDMLRVRVIDIIIKLIKLISPGIKPLFGIINTGTFSSTFGNDLFVMVMIN